MNKIKKNVVGSLLNHLYGIVLLVTNILKFVFKDMVILHQLTFVLINMTPLQKEIEAFEKEFIIFVRPRFPVKDFQGWDDYGDSVLLQEVSPKDINTLTRFTRSVIEQAMPEEKNEDNDQDFYIDYVRNKGWNEYRTQFKANVERILKDNEKEV